MKPILRVTDIWKRYEAMDEPVVRGINFELKHGEILSLLGPSGCGKTTTLRLIAGFERAEKGRVFLRDRILADDRTHVRPEARGIGFVFQEYALFPHLDVLHNVQFGLNRLPRKERQRRAREVLDMVGLSGLEKRGAHELSGGQQQRVALARSLAPGPEVILLDEPFSNLDAALRSETRAEVRRILKDNNMSAVLVTHDQEEALSFSDRVAVMNDGRIIQAGKPQTVYRTPATPFVAQFLGTTNIIHAQATGLQARTPLGTLALSREATGDILLSVRPEQLVIQRPANGEATGVIIAREFKGHDQIYRVRYANEDFRVMTDHLCDFQEGDRVTIHTQEPAVVLTADTE